MLSGLLSDATVAATTSMVLPMSLADSGGAVVIGVLARNSHGCEVLVTATQPVTLTAPSLGALATMLMPGVTGDSVGGGPSQSLSSQVRWVTCIEFMHCL